VGKTPSLTTAYESLSITRHGLAYIFVDTMNSGEPEAFNVGFLIGLVDALLRARKTYSRETLADREGTRA